MKTPRIRYRRASGAPRTSRASDMTSSEDTGPLPADMSPVHDGSPGSRSALASLAPVAPVPSLTRIGALTARGVVDTRAERRARLAIGPVWVLTRAVMLWLLIHDSLGVRGVAREVHVLYQWWYGQLSQGSFPLNDVTWQYPPGAALVFLSPAMLPWLTYFQAFVALTLLADAAVAAALFRAGLRGGRAGLEGAWVWVGGLPLLLHVPLARYDVQVTAVAVFAVLALKAGLPRISGALAGIGAMIKGWPALTLVGTPRGRSTRSAWLTAFTTATALLVVLAAGFSHSLGFLRQQGDRGVQIESLGGTALGLARAMGLWQGTVQYRYGAFEFVGPHVSTVGRFSLLLTAAAFCWLVLWRLRARQWTPAVPLDSALAAVLLFTVTSRVISPQYMIWLLGLAAVCLTARHTTQRPVVMLLLPATALSALAYPVLYEDVIASSALGCVVMVLRNGLLLAAALLSCRRLWKATE